jgi:hypothetical protein
VSRAARSAAQQVEDRRDRRLKVYSQTLDDLGRFDRIFGLMLIQGDRVPELQESVQAAVQPDEPALGEGEQAAHVVAMAALGGYHLFSIMQGRPFHGVSQAEFLQMLADFTEPRSDDAGPAPMDQRVGG